MTPKIVPSRIVTPGKILSRELKARAWKKEDLAQKMGYSVETIAAILNGNQEITTDIANDLSKSLETSAEVWINLETNYRSHLANQDKVRLYES